jgi:hypothetical protein
MVIGEDHPNTIRASRSGTRLIGCNVQASWHGTRLRLQSTPVDGVKAQTEGGEVRDRSLVHERASVDAKKRELIGDFKAVGREFQPKGRPVGH